MQYIIYFLVLITIIVYLFEIVAFLNTLVEYLFQKQLN
jgi:membrane associated rhomboid family serine protease